MEQKEIDYIVEWFESGDGKRCDVVPDLPLWAIDWSSSEEDGKCLVWLDSPGILIAKLVVENRKLRAAFEQACETAENGWAVGDGPSHSLGITIMRANRAGFLK